MKNLKKNCPWCAHHTGSCDPKDCDFKSLPYEKDAILDRMRKESGVIHDIQMRIVDMEGAPIKTMADEDMVTLIDLTKGLQIMADRLIIDFGMREKDIKKALGIKQMSISQKMKVAMKLYELRSMRKKK